MAGRFQAREFRPVPNINQSPGNQHPHLENLDIPILVRQMPQRLPRALARECHVAWPVYPDSLIRITFGRSANVLGA
jgi:hypothetical protein